MDSVKSVAEAIQTLVSAVQVAQNKGVYSLEEAHIIFLSIDYLNKLSQQAQANNQEQAQQAEKATEQGNQ